MTSEQVFMRKTFINMRLFPIIFSLILINTVSAQVGIGTLTPSPSAILDLSSINKGLLLPRVNLLSVSDASTINSPERGLIIYNTNTSIGEGIYVNMGTSTTPNWSPVSLYNSRMGSNIGKIIYNSSNGDNTKIVTVKNFSFRIGGISGNSNVIQIRMNENPGTNTVINVNAMEFFSIDRFQHLTSSISFTTSNWNTFQGIGFLADLGPNSYRIVYFGYLQTNSFYRITAARQGNNPYTYSLIVEEY